MAILPTRILEIEFTAGTWTDVTADLVDLTCRRGRNRELGAFETGQLTFTLRNDTRTYDPDNAAGPYYGRLRPNRRVRFRATYNALTYPIWQGYLDRIAQNYGGPNDATATFDASDLFKLLQRVELPDSVYIAEKTALTPDLWWRLSEPAGTTTLYDTVSRLGARTLGTPGLGAAGLVVRDPGSAMGVTGSLTSGTGIIVERVTYPTAGIAGAGAFTVEAWIQCSPQTDDATIFYQGSVSDIATFVQLLVRGAGAFVGKLELRIGIAAVAQSTVRVDDGAVHHVVGVRNAAGAMFVYVDGVDRTTTPVSNAASIPADDMSIGATPWQSFGLTGSIQHVGIWRTVGLTAGQVATLNTAGRTPWNGDTSGTRVNRILDLAAVPVGDRAIDTGSTTLQSTSLGGSALAYVQKVEETEAGRLFVSADGKVTFVSRANGITGTFLTPMYTLVDADSGAGIGYRNPSADVDESAIVTRATVSREGSVAITYFDAAAKAEFGWLDQTLDGLLHNDDAYSKAYAEWLVNTQKTPISRVGAVDVELPADPVNNYPNVLPSEVARRVTYKRKPQNVGAVMTIDMRVEAVSHETGGGYWRTRLQLSPFDLAGQPVGIWDTSLWDQAVWGF